MGAKAVLIIHTTPTAGYSYDVVRSSWGKEDPALKLAAGDTAGVCWMRLSTQAAGETSPPWPGKGC